MCLCAYVLKKNTKTTINIFYTLIDIYIIFFIFFAANFKTKIYLF